MKNNEKTDLEKTEDKYFCLLYPGINTILEKFGFPYKIVRPCPTKIVTYDGKERRADFFGQLDNEDIISLEAHSTAIRPYKSFKTLDGDKTINNISLKNKNNEELSKSEIGDLRILTFMKSKRLPKELLIKSIELTVDAKIDESALDFKGILGRRDRIYYEEGQKSRNYQIAKDLIKEGLDDETIKRITKLNQKEYEKLKQQCSK